MIRKIRDRIVMILAECDYEPIELASALTALQVSIRILSPELLYHADPAALAIEHFVPRPIWSVTAFSLGIMQIIALGINGRSVFPLVSLRRLATWFSASFWLLTAIGSAVSRAPGAEAWATLAALMLWAYIRQSRDRTWKPRQQPETSSRES